MKSNMIVHDEGWMVCANVFKNLNDGYVPQVNPENIKFFTIQQNPAQIFGVRDNSDDKQSF